MLLEITPFLAFKLRVGSICKTFWQMPAFLDPTRDRQLLHLSRFCPTGAGVHSQGIGDRVWLAWRI